MLVICFIFALSIRALFAFLETVITGLQVYHLDALSKKSVPGRVLTHTLSHSPHRLLIAILFVSSIADIIAGTLAAHITTTALLCFNISQGIGMSLGIGLASMAIILFGEIIPKNVARHQGQHYFFYCARILNILYSSTYYLVSILTWISEKIIALISPSPSDIRQRSLHAASPQEILSIVKHAHQNGAIDSPRAAIIESLCTLDISPIHHEMRPLIELLSCPFPSSFIAVKTTASLAHVLSLLYTQDSEIAFVYDDITKETIGYVKISSILQKIMNAPLKFQESSKQDFLQEDSTITLQKSFADTISL